MLHIKVPATSANIGPGFDTLGVAFDLYQEIKIEKSKDGSSHTVWPNDACMIEDADNLVIRGIESVFLHFNASSVPYVLEMSQCDIPISRGLGSSAAAYACGIAAGLYLLDLPLDKALICKIGTHLEGHPDNIAPAVFGGMMTAFYEEMQVYYQPITINMPLQFLALVPDMPLSTEKARAILPKVYERKDVIFNLGRLSMLISSLANGSMAHLKMATQDKIHTPYRMSLMPDYQLLSEIQVLDECQGSFISGAGSTFMYLCSPNDLTTSCIKIHDILRASKNKWQLKPLSITDTGMHWEEIL